MPIKDRSERCWGLPVLHLGWFRPSTAKSVLQHRKFAPFSQRSGDRSSRT
jgi:hypothetical protein